MSTKWFWVRVIVALILIGLVVVGGYAAYRTGWSQGYTAGQLMAEGERGTTMPPGFGYPMHPFVFAPYSGAGLLLTVVLALLFFAVIGKLIRFVIWGPVWRHAMTGPWARHSARWHRMHGPVPPGWWGFEEPPEEWTKTAKPNADTEAAD
jgi:hypothetical protein